MKTKLLFCAVVLSICNSFSQTVPSYVPTNGLIAWYPFNGNANDESGNGNNGVVNGALLTTDRNLLTNNCYNFNLNNWTWGAGGDLIYIPHNLQFNSSNLTVSAWFMRTSDGTGNQGLSIIKRFEFGYNNPNGQAWGISMEQANNYVLSSYIIEPSSQNNQQVLSNSGSLIQPNLWYHVVFTYDGQSVKQYTNGTLISMNTSNSFILNTLGNSGISIGMSKQANGNWAPFGGKIDDIGLWNRALSATEVSNLYQSIPLAIDNQIFETSKIYPNPVSDKLNIDIENSNIGTEYKIIDQTGRLIITGKLNLEDNTIDVNSLSKGIYFLNIKNEFNKSYKFIKN